MRGIGRNWAILLGVFGVLFLTSGVRANAGGVADTLQPEYTWPDGFSWYGESGAQLAPVYDQEMPGYWWMPAAAPAGQEDTQWGNRGYIFVGAHKATPQPAPAPVAATPKPVEKIVYVDKPVEKIVYVDRVVDRPVEKIVYVDKPVEKIVYVDKPVVEKVKTVRLTDVFFNFDRSNLTPLAESTLKENLEVLKTNPEVKILLIGSASQEGTNAYNQRLSQRRVNTVSTWLLNAGISQSRFITDAIGEVETTKAEYPSARKVQVNITELGTGK